MPAMIVGGNNPLNMEELLRKTVLNVLMHRVFSFVHLLIPIVLSLVLRGCCSGLLVWSVLHFLDRVSH